MRNATTVFFLLLFTAVAAANWPGWRGPTGQGLADVKATPLTWSFERDTVPKHAWKSPLRGSGNSSPIVWGDRIFITAALEDGTRLVSCHSLKDGKLLWEAAGPSKAREKLSGDGKDAGHASPTPAADGERVYAYFGPAGMLCVDFTGKQVWHRDFGPIDHVWGTGASPALCGEFVIVNGDNDKDSFLYALDRKTGEIQWKTKRAAGGGWSTPIIVKTAAGEELVVAGAHAVIAYDPRSGKELWRCEGLSETVCPTPVAGRGLIFAVSGRNGPTLAIRPNGKGNVTQTHIAWSQKRGGPAVPSPILVGGLLYVLNDGGLLSCYDAKSGERHYVERLDGTFWSSPVAAGERIYFTNTEGTTTVVAPGTKYRSLATNQLGERCVASPAVVEGAMIFRGDKHLFCLRTPPVP
jgi:outer membrane protein assembly factor BamB